MHRTISDYKITKRKDGRYYVRIRDKGDVTHIYGKTKAEVKAKLEIKIEELNTLDRRRTERSFPTRNITLANWSIRPSLRSQTLWFSSTSTSYPDLVERTE